MEAHCGWLAAQACIRAWVSSTHVHMASLCVPACDFLVLTCCFRLRAISTSYCQVGVWLAETARQVQLREIGP